MSRIQALQSLTLVAFLTLAASSTGHAAEAGELVRSSPAIQKSRAGPAGDAESAARAHHESVQGRPGRREAPRQ